ncbi:hypothetical protein F5Y18DRAFT_440437 [Xylariaceae sp. FL1019]|nr:hypothetical protein F5Y18DRAFT_440437 [Xylariaceae sp. FL1019]
MDTNKRNEDPIEKLFKALPDRFTYYEASAEDITETFQSFSLSTKINSNDPDRHELYRLVGSFQQSPDLDRLYSGLGKLATDKKHILADGSAKSKHLEMYAWVARGRKDESRIDKDVSGDTSQEIDHRSLSMICDTCQQPIAMPSCAVPCPGCLDKPNVKPSPHMFVGSTYCSDKCRATRAQIHTESYCKTIKGFSRAVSLLQDLVIMLLERSYIQLSIKSVTEDKGILEVEHKTELAWEIQGVPVMGPSSAQIPEDLPEEDKEAVLLFCESDNILLDCRGLVQLLLKPLCEELTYVSGVMVRNIHRPTRVSYRGEVTNNANTGHSVLVAKFGNGEHSVVDLTAAQFGWHETIAPRDAWYEHRHVRTNESQSWEAFFQEDKESSSLSDDTYIQVGNWQRSLLAQKMLQAVQDTMRENNIVSANELLDLADDTFNRLTQDIKDNAGNALVEGYDRILGSDVGKTYADLSHVLHATTSSEQSKAFDTVWLTDEDMEDLNSDEERWDEYIERCRDPARREKFDSAGLNVEKLFMPPS